MGILDQLRERGRRRADFAFDADGQRVSATFEALPRADYEELEAAHVDKGGDYTPSLLPALASACDVDGGSVDDWTDVVEGTLSMGEVNALRMFLLTLNLGMPEQRTGKG